MFVIKVPGINGLGKTKGCERAGNAVLKALNEIYSNEQGKPINTKLLDIEEIHLDNSNLEEANSLIYKNALEIFEAKPKSFFIGGDHSISYSLAKAFLDFEKNKGREPCLVVLDAHPDCMEPVDRNMPTHEEWLRALVESGFPPRNILLVGSRNSWPTETKFIKEKGIQQISINSFLDDLQNACDTITEFSNGKDLYLSIDVDVVDPAFAPATGYQELGGLTSRQIIYLIQRLNKTKNLKGIDLVEINPEKDSSGITVKLGAKILSEFL